MWKWNDQHVTRVGQRKNLSPWQDVIRFFLCPMLVTCWSFHFHIYFTELKIYHLSFLSPHNATLALLILAVGLTSVKYEPSTVYGLALHEFSIAPVDRVPARCLGGQRFESRRGLRFFLCPTQVTCWSFHFHNVYCVTPNHSKDQDMPQNHKLINVLAFSLVCHTW